MKVKTILLVFILNVCGLNMYAQSEHGLSQDERETIEQRVIEKINDFLSYLPEIAAKSNKPQDEKLLALKYIDKALELFIGEGNDYAYKDQAGNKRWHEAVKMQTTSRGRANRPQPMKRYLKRLMALPYQDVEIDTCSAVRISTKLHEVGDGLYTGSAYFIQAFRATSDGRLVVNDKDAKQVTIYVKQVPVIADVHGKKEYTWIIKLGDIRITTQWGNN